MRSAVLLIRRIFNLIDGLMLGGKAARADEDYKHTTQQLQSLGYQLLTRSKQGDLYINVSGSTVTLDARRTTTSTSLVCPPGSVAVNDRQTCGTWTLTLPVAYLRGHWAIAPEDFLAPKCRLKRRLTGSSRFEKITKFVATRWHILRLNAPNSITAGAPRQTPLGSLQLTVFT